MADTKTTALTVLTLLAAGDLVMVVDVDDTTMSANGTNKKITKADLLKASSGASAPSSTPDYVGQLYVETTTPTLYYAKGTSSSSDWVSVSSGGSGGQSMVDPIIYNGDGIITTGTKIEFIVQEAFTVDDVSISSSIAPTDSGIKVDIRKNSNVSTSSIFTSDTPVEIATSTTATNGLYEASSNTIDNGSFSVGDKFIAIVTQIGSTIAGADLKVQIKKS